MQSSSSTTQRRTTFALHVTLGYGSDNKTEEDLNKACSKQRIGLGEMASSFFSASSSAGDTFTNHDRHQLFVASASNVRLSINPSEKFWTTNINLCVVFLPPHMIASALEKHFSSNQVASGSSFWVDRHSSASFAKHLLPKVNSALENCRIRGIILTSILASNAPAELLILEVPKGRSALDSIIQTANGCTIADDPDSGVLKILPIAAIKFTHEEENQSLSSETKIGQPTQTVGNDADSSTIGKVLQLPTCPVCIHRIDPIRFGLPRPSVQQLCSKFCPSPSLMVDRWETEEEICHKQRLLKKWALPARCKACQVIDHYWNYNNCKFGDEEDRDLFCAECSMHKTLWVCLTCGFVGCGRYSNKHSVAHFEQTGHPYSLELATLRIWDYCQGEYGGFVQRADLLECPSSPPLLYPWLTRGLDFDQGESISSLHQSAQNNRGSSQFDSIGNSAVSKATGKSSKKVMMIGEEYEALLHSALEDQAQHYEDEITRLRARHTDFLVDRNNMIPEEAKEIEELRLEIKIAREDVANVSKELIEAQAQEVKLRAVSTQLLSEQQESNELLKKIKDEHRRENKEGSLQIEELEQHIADLKANLRMKQEFARNNELSNAQILCTNTPTVPGGRKGKKKGRFSRR